MNIYQYTAWNNRAGSDELVSSYGMTPIEHPNELARQLAMIVSKDKDALKKVVSIHPDSQLFGNSGFKLPEEKEHSNACGCSNFSNMDGQSIKREVESVVGSQKSEKTELFIIGGIIITLALILRK